MDLMGITDTPAFAPANRGSVRRAEIERKRLGRRAEIERKRLGFAPRQNGLR